MISADDLSELPATIRVGVANLHGVVLELIVGLIQQQQDMVLMGPVETPLGALLELGAFVDVLILGASVVYPLPGICSHLLSEFPFLKILVLSNTGDDTVLCWLGLREQHLNSLAPDMLLDSIRAAHHLNPAV